MATLERTLFYDNGRLLSAYERIDGETEIIRTWTEDGTLILEAHLSNSEYHGPYKSWRDTGVLKKVGAFHRDKRVSIYRWYNESGDLWQEADCGNVL
jgi:antitoxin component YwqK of YwqJK toxin-antitoxin module